MFNLQIGCFKQFKSKTVIKEELFQVFFFCSTTHTCANEYGNKTDRLYENIQLQSQLTTQ